MMVVPTTGPMSDEALELLEQQLKSIGCIGIGADLESLDGFFSALIVGPSEVSPEEYLPYIFGNTAEDEMIEWKSEEQFGDVLQSLLSFWNHILWRLSIELSDDDSDNTDEENEFEAQAMPILSMPVPDGEVDDDFDIEEFMENDMSNFPYAVMWANGFIQGMRLRFNIWTEWLEENPEFGEIIKNIMDLSIIDADHAKEIDYDLEEPLTISERIEFVSVLPFWLKDFYTQRLVEDEESEDENEELPYASHHFTDSIELRCPCGSGTPFKECCGSPKKLN